MVEKIHELPARLIQEEMISSTPSHSGSQDKNKHITAEKKGFKDVNTRIIYI
jgi:hypothetical protein